MAEAFIAIGSNLGNRLQYIKKAVSHIKNLGKISGIAPLYESQPYGYINQPNFLNSLLVLETNLRPQKLLGKLQEIEEYVGRRSNFRWGPREIDLDIIFYNQEVIKTDQLKIPHSDFHNRSFVLKPFVDIAPEFKSPVHHKTVLQIYESCRDQTKLDLVSTNWYSNGIEI